MRLPRLSSVYTRESDLGDFDLVECTSCGTWVTTPLPTSEQLSEVYGRTYVYELHRLVHGEKKRRARLLVDRLRRQLRGERIVELGCGGGEMLAAFTAIGIEAKGCEINDEAVAFARASGLAVTKSGAEDFVRSVDLAGTDVFMSHFLEHVLAPGEFLRELATRLDPDAVVAVVVPNRDARWKGPLERRWGYWQVPIHVSHFNADSLGRVFSATGFRPVGWTTRGADFLSVGVGVANVLSLRSSAATPGALGQALIQRLSTPWARTYERGSQELVMWARRV